MVHAAFYPDNSEKMVANDEEVVPRAFDVVPGQADAEPMVIHANRTDMVRYTSRNNGRYGTISEELQIMTEEAPGAIRLRWEVERRMSLGRNTF
jgi:hypothetical protein